MNCREPIGYACVPRAARIDNARRYLAAHTLIACKNEGKSYSQSLALPVVRYCNAARTASNTATCACDNDRSVGLGNAALMTTMSLSLGAIRICWPKMPCAE